MSKTANVAGKDRAGATKAGLSRTGSVSPALRSILVSICLLSCILADQSPAQCQEDLHLPPGLSNWIEINIERRAEAISLLSSERSLRELVRRLSRVVAEADYLSTLDEAEFNQQLPLVVQQNRNAFTDPERFNDPIPIGLTPEEQLEFDRLTARLNHVAEFTRHGSHQTDYQFLELGLNALRFVAGATTATDRRQRAQAAIPKLRSDLQELANSYASQKRPGFSLNQTYDELLDPLPEQLAAVATRSVRDDFRRYFELLARRFQVANLPSNDLLHLDAITFQIHVLQIDLENGCADEHSYADWAGAVERRFTAQIDRLVNASTTTNHAPDGYFELVSAANRQLELISFFRNQSDPADHIITSIDPSRLLGTITTPAEAADAVEQSLIEINDAESEIARIRQARVKPTDDFFDQRFWNELPFHPSPTLDGQPMLVTVANAPDSPTHANTLARAFQFENQLATEAPIRWEVTFGDTTIQLTVAAPAILTSSGRSSNLAPELLQYVDVGGEPRLIDVRDSIALEAGAAYRTSLHDSYHSRLRRETNFRPAYLAFTHQGHWFAFVVTHIRSTSDETELIEFLKCLVLGDSSSLSSPSVDTGIESGGE